MLGIVNSFFLDLLYTFLLLTRNLSFGFLLPLLAELAERVCRLVLSPTLGRLAMGSEASAGDVSFLAKLALIGSLIVVKSLVQPQVNCLGEFLRTFVTGVGLFSHVKSHVCL